MTEEIVGKITVTYAIKMYKRYRHNTSLLLNEKRYVMEAFWRHCELANECLRTYDDWLFEYFFSGFEVKK